MSRKLVLVLALAAAVAAVVIAPTPAGAANVYVSERGSDAAPGTTSQPLRTIRAALQRSTDGGRVFVAPGAYPEVRDDFARAKKVRVISTRPLGASIAKLTVAGGQHVSYERFRMPGGFAVGDHPTRKLRQTADDVAFVDNDVSTPSNYYCSTVRNGATRVTIARNTFHDCRSGVVGIGNAPRSSRITIVDNTMRDLTADGVQFGNWWDVTIARNSIKDVIDPTGKEHNDGIQIMGDAQRVRIVANSIFNTDGQLLFMQEDLGSVHDVRVEGNVMAGTTGYAIQSIGVSKAVFVGNTIWDGRIGGLLIKPGKVNSAGVADLPNDGVVVNNVLSTYVEYKGARAAVREGNFVRCSTAKLPSGVDCVTDPGFVNPLAYDFRLRADSRLAEAGAAYSSSAIGAEGTGRGSTRTPGAY